MTARARGLSTVAVLSIAAPEDVAAAPADLPAAVDVLVPAGALDELDAPR